MNSIITPGERPPIVTIGMPVYNGEKTLARVFDSLLGQSFGDFILLVSDNASTDETHAICARYSEYDSRLRYVRQEKNIGAEANFQYVFRGAQSEFFMWAAADDVRSTDFLSVNLEFLRVHSDYVGSTSPVRFEGGDFDPIKMGDRSLDENNPYRRIMNVFGAWHANGLFYSLFRTSAVATWPQLEDFSFLGADWTLVTHLASIGKLKRLNIGWVELGMNGMSNSTDIFSRYRESRLDWVVPFRRLTTDTLSKISRASLSTRLVVVARLIRFNLQGFVAQIRLYRRYNVSENEAKNADGNY